MVLCDTKSYGCPWSGLRKELPTHLLSCPFTLLRPVLEAQNERLRALELQNRALRKKVDLLSPRSTTGDSLSIDDQAYHILEEQEHMRNDIERLNASLGELEIKQGMLLMNENLRTKEELAGVRAAIQGMRMQIHWLLSTRIHNGEHHNNRHSMGAPVMGIGMGSTTANPPSHSGSDPSTRRLSGQ